MYKIVHSFKLMLLGFAIMGLLGCATVPKGFLRPSESSLKDRQLQSRQYETTDQEKILSSVAGALQDLGFTLDASETQVGFIAASKKADATNAGMVFLAAFFGGQNAVAQCDKSQVVKASVITKPSLDGNKSVVRVTFQRVVWNMMGQINTVESINDPQIYQKFFDSLSKAIFLEAQQI